MNYPLSLFFVTSVLLELILPTWALPGISVDEAIAHFHNNELSRNATFQELTINGINAGYRTFVEYESIPVGIFIAPPNLGLNRYLSEGIFVENSSIGTRLSEQNYNLRQDPAFLDLVRGLWGEEISQDFMSSQFTDSRASAEPGPGHITAYKGERFGYVARLRTSPVGDEFSFNIYTLEDWETMRLPPGY